MVVAGTGCVLDAIELTLGGPNVSLNSTEPAITGTNVKITELAPCRRHEDGALWI